MVVVARTAGKMMITETDITVENKGSKENYVTSTDLKIQTYLRKELLEILPGSEFMGEENDLLSTESEHYDIDHPVWIVDPIDGTANYAHKIPMSVVSIALVKNHESILGVVYQPYLDELYKAEKGKGAFLNDVPIHVSDRPKERGICCTAWSCYNKTKSALCFQVTTELYKICEDIRRLGTAAYELCLMAKGACELYFEINLSPWDYAAASCILYEAGGCMTSNKQVLDYYAPCTVIAANCDNSLQFVRNIVKKACQDHPEAETTIKD